VDFSTPGAPRLEVRPKDGEPYPLKARFVCDASGAGRVLPRMLDLERPVDAPPRAAIFTHVEDKISAPDFRRDNTLLCIHPERPDVWYWLIPFNDGRASLGVVGSPECITGQSGEPLQQLQTLVTQEPCVARLLSAAVYDRAVWKVSNYAAGVTALHGHDYALLGNAGGFVDPVFSYGVTVALKSSVLASDLIDRQLRGLEADWDGAFDAPLRAGVRVFDTFVKAWYDGSLKHVFFKQDVPPRIRSMVGSVLAGYVWDQNNPYVTRPEQRLRTLCEACAP
jgi:flavin-dependent dehydrogenase